MATTWTTLDALTAKAVDTTGTGSAPSLVTDGLDLSGIGSKNGFTVVYESTGSVFTSGALQAYLYCANAASGSGLWARAPGMDLTVQALSSQAFVGTSIIVPIGRIAFVPVGTAQPGIVWVLGTASQY